MSEVLETRQVDGTGYSADFMRSTAGKWTARVLRLPGISVEAATEDEVEDLAQEAIAIWLAEARERGLPVPDPLHVGTLETASQGFWYGWVHLGSHMVSGCGETMEEAQADVLKCIEVFEDSYRDKGSPIPSVLREPIVFEVCLFEYEGAEENGDLRRTVLQRLY